ncbi:MAG: hypothetical protein OK455_01725 [Thaumarchaeota archaeon]|nr:hypothetical protein [Nitrososphaerota archaeon]
MAIAVAGAGVVVASVMIPGGVLTSGRVLQASSNKFTFRAVGGLPQGNFPSYASYVMEGAIDLEAHSGVTTTNVFAGPPEAMTAIALPGLSRSIRITEVDSSGSLLTLRGVIDDTAQLQRGEDSHVEITIDSSQSAASSTFINSKVGLKLA